MVLKKLPDGLQLPGPSSGPSYSIRDGARGAFQELLKASHQELPAEFLQQQDHVDFIAHVAEDDKPLFPCPLKEQEAVAAIKALEGAIAASIADLRFGHKERAINVDLAKTTCFLMSAYVTTVDGLDKTNPRIKNKLPGTLPFSGKRLGPPYTVSTSPNLL